MGEKKEKRSSIKQLSAKLTKSKENSEALEHISKYLANNEEKHKKSKLKGRRATKKNKKLLQEEIEDKEETTEMKPETSLDESTKTNSPTDESASSKIEDMFNSEGSQDMTDYTVIRDSDVDTGDNKKTENVSADVATNAATDITTDIATGITTDVDTGETNKIDQVSADVSTDATANTTTTENTNDNSGEEKKTKIVSDEAATGITTPVTIKVSRTPESPQTVTPNHSQLLVNECQNRGTESPRTSQEPELLPNAPAIGKGGYTEFSRDDYLNHLKQLAKSYRAYGIQYRLNQLRNLYYILKDNEIIFNTGTKYVTILNDIVHTMVQLKNWDKPEPVKPLPFSLAMNPVYVERIPLGLVLLVADTFYNVIDALVGCIASGNCCVVKLNDDKYNIGELLNEAVEPIHIVEGGEEELAMLLQKEKYDKIVNFNTNIQHTVAITTYPTLTPVEHETGKSLALILNDIDAVGIKVACRRISWGYAEFGGVDYVLVPESLHDLFITEIKQVEPIPTKDSNEQEHDSEHIGETEHADDSGNERNNRKLPTILDMATWDDLDKRGDIIPVLTYTKLDETCELINMNHATNTLYVFTNGPANKTHNKFVNTIATKVKSKGLIVNDVLPLSLVDAPNGSIYGWFKKLTHERTTIEQYLWNDWILKARYPPYSANKEEIISYGQSSFGGRVWFGRTGDVPTDGPTEVFRTWTGILGVIGLLWEYMRG